MQKPTVCFVPYGDDATMHPLHGDDEYEMCQLGRKLAALAATHCPKAVFVQAVEVPFEFRPQLMAEMAKTSQKRAQSVEVMLEGKTYYLLASNAGYHLINITQCPVKTRSWIFYRTDPAHAPQPAQAMQATVA